MVLKLWQQTDRQNRTEWQLAVTREAADYYYFGKHPRISGLSLFLDAHYDYENAISRSRALSLSLSLFTLLSLAYHAGPSTAPFPPPSLHLGRSQECDGRLRCGQRDQKAKLVENLLWTT